MRPGTSRRFSSCLLAVAAGLLLACASDEERFAEHMARAQEYVEQDQIKEAILEYRSALKINPKDPEINHRIADLARDQGAVADAVFFYREAYRLDPSRIRAAMEEAQLLLFSDIERTKAIIQEGLERYPNMAIVHVARSQLALVDGDTDEALTAILTATQLAPDDSQVWMQVGTVHEARIREQRLIARTVPADSIFESAIRAFERADAIDGGSIPARVERARVLGSWPGHMEEAEAAYREAVALAVESGDDDALLLTAGAAEDFATKVKLHDMRRWALRQMIAADDSRLRTWDELARLTDGRGENGEDVYRDLLEKRPDDSRAYGFYAGYLVRKSQVPEAIALLSDAIENGHGTPALWEQMLRIHIASSQLPAARAVYVGMADAYPEDPLTQRAQARIALAERRPARAAGILRALVGRSEDFETQRLLALAEYRLGNLPNATAAVDRALALASEFSPEAVRLKALIHHDAEDWGSALRSLRTLIGRGIRLSAEERLMRARALYETRRARVGRQVLEMILSEPEPPPGAAVEYARREGKRKERRAYLYLLDAYKRAPLNHEVLGELMKLDIKTRRPQQSLARLNEVIQTGRAGPRILLLRAELLARTGALDRAEADALRAFEAAPELPKAVDLLLAIYTSQNRLDEAKRSFEEAELAGVLHSGARLLLGRLYLFLGENDKAEEMFEKVLAEQPDHAGAKNDLAFLLAEQARDLDRALRLAQEAQEALGKTANAADTVGYVFYRKELYEAALQQFRYALELAEANRDKPAPAYHYHLGLTLRALGRDTEATRSFQRALEIDADFPNAEDARRQLEAARRSVSESQTPS